MLEQQLTRLDHSVRELAELNLEKEPELGLRQLLTVLRESIDQLHRHRDGVQTLLAGFRIARERVNRFRTAAVSRSVDRTD